MAEYLSQDSDYHDLLRTKLGDLQGADTLIHELTQNAHDAYQEALTGYVVLGVFVGLAFVRMRR